MISIISTRGVSPVNSASIRHDLLADQKRVSSKSPDATTQSGYATNFGASMIGPGIGVSGASGMGIGGGAGVLSSGVAPSYNAGGYGARGIEGQIIACVFKVLVTRLVSYAKQLKAQENISLYCEVRQLMTYVKEAHGGIFRRVALSGILDSADRPNKRCNSNVQTTRVIRCVDICKSARTHSTFRCARQRNAF